MILVLDQKKNRMPSAVHVRVGVFRGLEGTFITQSLCDDPCMLTMEVAST